MKTQMLIELLDTLAVYRQKAMNEGPFEDWGDYAKAGEALERILKRRGYTINVDGEGKHHLERIKKEQ
jgi:hypothetical protein